MTQTAAIKEGLRETKKSPKAKAKAAVDQAAETIEKSVDHAQDVVSEMTHQANDELRKMTDSGAKFVRENPGTAIAGALGVGVLLGLALRGRD